MLSAVPETLGRIRSAVMLNRTGESNKPIRGNIMRCFLVGTTTERFSCPDATEKTLVFKPTDLECRC